MWVKFDFIEIYDSGLVKRGLMLGNMGYQRSNSAVMLFKLTEGAVQMFFFTNMSILQRGGCTEGLVYKRVVFEIGFVTRVLEKIELLKYGSS